MATTEDVIMTYWRSWQQRPPDLDTMRSCLADELDMEPQPMMADEFAEMVAQGSPWDDVTMIDTLFTNDRGALLYQGTNTANGETIRIGEILTVEDGKITRIRAAIPATAFG